MNKELLDILNELSKKDTTDLAMSCMELQADVLIKENEKEELQSRIDKAIEYIENHKLNFKQGITTFGSERLSMEERKLLDILRGYDE